MKIAIFHNYLDNIGGSEKVALIMAREFSADVYTTNINKEKIEKMGFSDVLPRIFSIGKIPKKAPFRQQIAFWRFRKLNLSGKYDFFIIAGDWAMSAAVNNFPNLWYVHSPLNELWEFESFVRKKMLNFWQRPIYRLWVIFNRSLTLKYSKMVGNFACNSLNTKKRLKKFYKKDAEVIYPPVYLKEALSKNINNTGDYWLSINRLTMMKRIDVQLKAFENLKNEKLIVVGSYEKGVSQFEKYKKYLEKIKPDNVEIRNWVSGDELEDLLLNCKGLLATAKNEDFGMSPLEAMSYGKPIIASFEGGYLETVIHEKTGLLVENINQQNLANAIKVVSKNLSKDSFFYYDNSVNQAKNFSVEIFINKIKKLLVK